MEHRYIFPEYGDWIDEPHEPPKKPETISKENLAIAFASLDAVDAMLKRRKEEGKIK